VSALSSPSLLSVVAATLRAAGCVFAEDEARLLVTAAATPVDLAAMVDKRVAGLPLEQVLGWARFCGLRIGVAPGVFVPRRRTELLARQAAALSRRANRPRPVVVDLCCGSGAVGAAIAATAPGIQLYATDIDPAAVRCAAANLYATGGAVCEGDLYAALPAALRGRVDVLVANAPYVPTGAIALLPAEARDHESHVALDGGVDGLDVQRRIAAGAPDWLAPGGHLLIETSDRQAAATVQTFRRNGLEARLARSTALDATVVIGGVTDPAAGAARSAP
jgi:release factor glutamine methyltransferase